MCQESDKHQICADIRRMLRSVYWVGDATIRLNILVVAVAIALGLTGLWIPAAFSIAVALLVLVAALKLFRRAEAQGKVAAAEQVYNNGWQSWREMGPIKRLAAILFLISIMLFVAVLRYLQWKWEIR